MDDREVRNEFGLDELNEQDVHNEAGPRFVLWALVGLAVFAVFAGLAFYTSTTSGVPTASNRPVATTTGSAATPPATTPPPPVGFGAKRH